MPLARASELDRLLACAGAVVLPVTDSRSASTKQAAEWGNECHSWIETGHTENPALLEKIQISGVDRLAHWPDGPGVDREIALAFNVVSGIVCHHRGSREEKEAWKLSFGDEWITGTLDYGGALFETPWVDDLKTGRRAVWEGFRAQQSLYCLAYGRHKHGETVDVRSTITHWPRYPKHSQPWRFGRLLTSETLESFWDELRTLRENILTARKTSVIKFTPGEHCRYCPGKLDCTAFRQEEMRNG